jgi:dihydrofolate synthase/folylpolyglutamate synthase
LGEYQLQNAATALTALHALREGGVPVGEGAIRGGLAQVNWPGRFEVIPGAPEIVLDGAHNEDGAFCFRKALDRYYPDRKIVPVIGTLRSKNSQRIIDIITGGQSQTVVCTEPPHGNALPARELAAYIKNAINILIYPNPEEALSAAMDAAGPDGVAAVAGSLYLVGGLRRVIYD